MDPARDLEAMLGELTFADLEVLERASTRLADQVNKTKPAERPMVVRQKETVDKARAGLENGVPVRLQTFSDSERSILVNYQLLTDKNVIAVFNTDEGADAKYLYPTWISILPSPPAWVRSASARGSRPS